MDCGAKHEKASAGIQYFSFGHFNSGKMVTPEGARGQQYDKQLFRKCNILQTDKEKLGLFFFLWKGGLGERGQAIFKRRKGMIPY